MIRCVLCDKEVVISGKGERVYAIEEGRIGGYVCKLESSQIVYHKPEVKLHETDR